MLIHPQIDPVAFAVGPLAVRWYGLMYLVGFGMAFLLARSRIKRGRSGNISFAVFDDLFFFCVLGVVLGGRWATSVYKPGYYFFAPLEIPPYGRAECPFTAVSGCSSPCLYIARKTRSAGAAYRFHRAADPARWPRAHRQPSMASCGGGSPACPGAWFRGAAAAAPSVAVVSVRPGGVLLFVILWLYSAASLAPRARYRVFLIGYGVLRFSAEFLREPDDFLGLLAFNLSMGQWLSLPMILAGVAMLAWTRRKV